MNENNELVELLQNGYINPNLLDDADTQADASAEALDAAANERQRLHKVVCADEQAAALWSRIVSKLGKRLNPTALATWFGEGAIVPVKLENQTFALCAANSVVKDWVGKNYAEELQTAVSEAAGKNHKIEIL